ncbi:MAG: hypothetical protein QM770_18635 [Tepidisphaeraceae bacterium]
MIWPTHLVRGDSRTPLTSIRWWRILCQRDDIGVDRLEWQTSNGIRKVALPQGKRREKIIRSLAPRRARFNPEIHSVETGALPRNVLKWPWLLALATAVVLAGILVATMQLAPASRVFGGPLVLTALVALFVVQIAWYRSVRARLVQPQRSTVVVHSIASVMAAFVVAMALLVISLGVLESLGR